MAHDLNPHERAPEVIRNAYAEYRKMKPVDREQDERIVDFGRGLTAEQNLNIRVVDLLDSTHLQAVFTTFEGSQSSDLSETVPSQIPVYEHNDVPGLHIIPNLLPQSTQIHLLNTILHRDLSNPLHRTNIHAHHVLEYPSSSSSFFSLPATNPPFAPHDKTHKTLPLDRLLRKSLRWVTLGGQYDWTEKTYPTTLPTPAPNGIDTARPPFPSDIAGLLRGIFPHTEPHAAIANIYSPGDILSPHRDVSESVGNGLVSCSIGCSGVFLISGREDEESETGAPKYLLLRLRSGDVVYMSGPSRWAWHGVPAVKQIHARSS